MIVRKETSKNLFMIQLIFFFLFLYQEVYKLHMVTAHIKSQSNTQKRIELVHVVRWTKNLSKDEK